MTKDELKAAARGLGFSAVGVCDAVPAPHLAFFDAWLARGHAAGMGWLAASRELRADVDALLPGARSVVAVALDYGRPNPPAPGRPRIARYALGRDYHKVMRGKLRRLAARVEAEGSACRPCVDSAPVFERDYACLAGLGFFGKNTMLIDPRRGSWSFLGLLLTTAHWEPDAPAEGGCGTCTRCLDACPTGAIVFADDRWSVDSRRCVSYLTIEHAGDIAPDLHEGVGDWTFGCDVCQEVCPFNAARPSQPLRGARATEPDLLLDREWPSLMEIEAMDESAWDLLTRGSPVRRTGRDGLRRNARINRANARLQPQGPHEVVPPRVEPLVAAPHADETPDELAAVRLEGEPQQVVVAAGTARQQVGEGGAGEFLVHIAPCEATVDQDANRATLHLQDERLGNGFAVDGLDGDLVAHASTLREKRADAS